MALADHLFIADDDGAERRLAHGNREFCLPQGKLHKVCVRVSELQHQVCSLDCNNITQRCGRAWVGSEEGAFEQKKVCRWIATDRYEKRGPAIGVKVVEAARFEGGSPFYYRGAHELNAHDRALTKQNRGLSLCHAIQ